MKTFLKNPAHILLVFALFLCGKMQAQTLREVAAGKRAYQSSAYPDGGFASYAVDGNTSGVWSHGSVTHTSMETDPWWEVDLGANYSISSVHVYNRTDCCAERLNTFTVYVKDDPNRRGQLLSNKDYTSTHTEVSNGTNVVGRYVRIQLHEYQYLSLAEVQVFGTPASDNGDGAIIDSRPQTVYMNVCTGNDGTDGDVYAHVELYNGQKHKILLDKPSYDDFEKGDSDQYDLGFSVYDLDQISGFYLSLDNGDDWFVTGASLTLYQTSNPQCPGNLNVELEGGTSTVWQAMY